MQRNKGFTLIELMVVVLIVAILAAVLVPMMRGRIDSAKWSEANAAAGQIRTAVRVFIAEKGPNFNYEALYGGVGVWGKTLGIEAYDLSGRYFRSVAYNIDKIYTAADGDFGTCDITVTAGGGEPPGGAPTNPTKMVLNCKGDWVAGN